MREKWRSGTSRAAPGVRGGDLAPHYQTDVELQCEMHWILNELLLDFMRWTYTALPSQTHPTVSDVGTVPFQTSWDGTLQTPNSVAERSGPDEFEERLALIGKSLLPQGCKHPETGDC